jgi:hypothetical protein
MADADDQAGEGGAGPPVSLAVSFITVRDRSARAARGASGLISIGSNPRRRHDPRPRKRVTCASSSSNDVLGGRVSGAAFATRGPAQPRSRARVTVWVTARRTMTGQTGTPMDARPAWAGSPPSPWSGWHGSGQPVCPLCAPDLRRPGSPCIVCNSLDADGRVLQLQEEPSQRGGQRAPPSAQGWTDKHRPPV